MQAIVLFLIHWHKSIESPVWLGKRRALHKLCVSRIRIFVKFHFLSRSIMISFYQAASELLRYPRSFQSYQFTICQAFHNAHHAIYDNKRPYTIKHVNTTKHQYIITGIIFWMTSACTAVGRRPILDGVRFWAASGFRRKFWSVGALFLRPYKLTLKATLDVKREE